MNKFKGKYRIQSHRKPYWNYSNSGHYFITMVTQNRECNLGEIVDGKMILSDFGKIIKTEWHKSFEIRDELFLDKFIIMPNHLHAIVVLKKNNETPNGFIDSYVETHGRASLPSIQQSPKQPFIRKPKSISSFVAGFKSAINTKIDDYIDENNLGIPKYNRNNHFFQHNYHDHIIRNEKSHQTISEYILKNPLKWNDDRYNPTNQGSDN